MTESLHLGEDDEGLVLRIRSGDARAEEDLARCYQTGLLAIARVRGAGSEAGDVVQETFAAALVNLRRGSFNGEGPLAAYLAGILRHKLARLRSPRNVPARGVVTSGGLDDDPLTAAVKAEGRQRLREALGRLPERHRRVLLLHYLDGRTAEEIGRLLGIPRGTVLSRLHHARIKLAALMSRSPSGRHRLVGRSTGGG